MMKKMRGGSMSKMGKVGKKDPYGNDQTKGLSGSNTAGPKKYTYKRKAGGMVGNNRLY